jgi:hypothetical protein
MEAAVVSAITALMVVILTNGLGRLLETRRRHDKSLDYIAALHAEIVAGLQTAEQQTSSEEREYSQSDATPFAVADETDFVFESIKGDLTILPMDVIHEVVIYYKLSQRSILLTKALNHDDFGRQGPAEKRKFISGLLLLLTEQETAAEAALMALERYAARFGRDLARKRQHVALSTAVSDDRNDGTAHD